MTEGGEYMEPLRDLHWFKEQLKQGFAQLAGKRKYSDDQYRQLVIALNQLEPRPDETDGLLVNLGVLSE